MRRKCGYTQVSAIPHARTLGRFGSPKGLKMRRQNSTDRERSGVAEGIYIATCTLDEHYHSHCSKFPLEDGKSIPPLEPY